MEMTAIIAERNLPHKLLPRPDEDSALFKADAKSGGLTVLVLDDEFLIASQMAQLMENFGWTIIGPAGSLEEARTLLEENDAPDAAILDINIGGTTVFALAETLYGKGVPILFCSGYEVIEEADRFIGCAKLRKPFGVGQIFTEITALMERKRTIHA